jgi:hypothetical protein
MIKCFFQYLNMLRLLREWQIKGVKTCKLFQNKLRHFIHISKCDFIISGNVEPFGWFAKPNYLLADPTRIKKKKKRDKKRKNIKINFLKKILKIRIWIRYPDGHTSAFIRIIWTFIRTYPDKLTDETDIHKIGRQWDLMTCAYK